MNRKLVAASLAALCVTGGAFTVSAADVTPVYSLQGIVVTANRVPEKQIDSNADVSVVSSKQIEEHHYNDVAQAIRNVPGVTIMSHGANSQSSNSDQIYINGSNNVVVLVDGMRRNTNGNSLSNSTISDMAGMDSIDHIEVLRGSASTLYGSDAQGGVINIITKKPTENKISTTLRTSFGDQDKEKYNFYNQGREGKVFWTLEAGKELQGNYKDGWGHRVINHLNAKHYNVKLGYDLGNDSDIVFNYEKYKADYVMPNNGSRDKTRAKGDKDDDAISLQYKQKINDRLTNLFSIYRNRESFNVPLQYFDMGMKTTGVSDQMIYKMNRQTLTGGVDWYQDEIYHYPSDLSVQGKQVTNTAFYLQDKIDLTDRWNITPGIRIDHHSEFGTHASPSFSVGYKQNDNTNYYFNYKTFFVAPSLYQLYASPMYYGPYVYNVGNKDLDPQEGNTFEFGINHRFNDNLTGTFNVFHTHAKNLITYGSNGYENSGKTNVNGFSLNLNEDFSQHWSAGVGYTFLHQQAKSGENINSDGRLPESVLNVDVTYQTSNFNASLDGHGVMNRYGEKQYPEMRDYANYWVWDLAANYTFTKGATLFARLNNIFDQFYTDVGSSYGPNGDPNQYQYWYSAPGRNFEVGLQFQF